MRSMTAAASRRRSVDRQLRARSERDALEARGTSGLHDIDLAAVLLHPHSETGQFVVPEEGVLAVRPQRLHEAGGQLEGASLGHGLLPSIEPRDARFRYRNRKRIRPDSGPIRRRSRTEMLEQDARRIKKNTQYQLVITLLALHIPLLAPLGTPRHGLVMWRVRRTSFRAGPSSRRKATPAGGRKDGYREMSVTIEPGCSEFGRDWFRDRFRWSGRDGTRVGGDEARAYGSAEA